MVKRKNNITLSASHKAIKRDTCLNKFFNELRNYKPLGQDDTDKLFQQYHNGTQEEREQAFQKLFKHNLRYVVSIARDYCGVNDSINDLIQEGSFGLMNAIEAYDVTNGSTFQSYSIFWIRKYINMYKFTNQTIIRTNQSKTNYGIKKIMSYYWQNFERKPTKEELMDEYNKRYPTRKIVNSNDLVDVEYVYISDIDSVSESDETTLLKDYFKYNNRSSSLNDIESVIERDSSKVIVNEFLKSLTKNERIVVSMYYGLDGYEQYGVDVIAEKVGVTPQRIRQLFNSSIDKMKRKKELVISSISK